MKKIVFLSLVVLFATVGVAFGQSMYVSSLTKVKDLTCNTCNDAVYRVVVVDAVFPISWEVHRDYGSAGTSFWAKGSSNTPEIDLTGLPKGGIAIYITDSRGQKAIGGFEVVQVITSAMDVKSSEVVVYPNPALAGEKIFINGTEEKVELYSISGKLIKTYDFTSSSGEITSPNIPGVYVLKTEKFATKLLVR